MSSDATLYERLGGEAGIEAAVDEFYDRVLADDSLAHYFEDTDVEELRAHQRSFLSTVTGGPEDYTGQEMYEAHAHLGITADDFGTVASHLEAALRDVGADDGDIEAVLEAVAELEPEIVQA